MATTANPFDDDIDLYKNSRKMMAAMLMRKISQQNPSLGGNILNAMALGLMGMQEKQAEERGAKGLGDVRKALEDAGVTTPSTTTPSTTTPPTKAESAPTSEPGPKTETPSVMPGKYPAAETGTSRPSTSKMTMPDLTPPALPTEREPPAQPTMMAGETRPAGMGDMVAPSLDRTLAFDPNQIKSQAMAAALLGAPSPGPVTAQAEQGPVAPDMLAGVRARAAAMGPALGPPPPSRPQATEMDRGPVYPPPPGAGEDWGPPNGYRGPGAPLPPAPAAPPAPAMSPEWQRLQEYQRSQGQPPQPPPPPAMMRPGYQPPGVPSGPPPGPQSMAVPPAAPSPPSAPSPEGRDPYSAAISRLESSSFKDPYTARGPDVRTQGGIHHAVGKYQVMDFNIGPWTEKHLGQRMSEAEFRASPAAQEAVFKGQFGEYVQKYGPERAARAWIGGEGGVDNPNARAVSASGKPIGLSVGEYSTRFANALGPEDRGRAPAAPVPQPAPYQVAQAGGGPPPGPPQAAPQRPGQNVLDQMRRLADTHPDPEVRNRANSIIINQRLQELNPPTIHWGKDDAGKDVPYSQDPRTGQVRRLQVQGEPPPEVRDPRVPERPKGVSQKDWDRELAQKMAERALGTSLPSETAGRLSMLQVAKQDFAQAKSALGGEWDKGKIAEFAAYKAGLGTYAGETGRAMRTMQLAVEGALRANTGATAPPNEVAYYMNLFAPAAFDGPKERAQKMDMMERFMNNMEKNIQQGRTLPGAGGGATPLVGSGGSTGGDGGGWSIRQIR